MPDDNARDAHQYRLAQASRILRFCRDNGIDPHDLQIGRVPESVLKPIENERGQVVPEPIDFINAEQ